MVEHLFKFYQMFLIALNMPVILAEYFHSKTGREYRVGFFSKLVLALKMVRNNIKITSASNFSEHLTMATKILNTPKSLEGCIVECGCYKGASTANLSLVASLCNRKVEVSDSFRGLPKPSDSDKAHTIINLNEVHTYLKGAWHGSLDEVKRNISQYGEISICNFNVGYFEDTMPKFKKKCMFIFLDVDLKDSTETCLRYLWSLLQNGCYLFTHEATHMEIASLFFDKQWWHYNFNCDVPGLVGAGSGLGLIPQKGAFKSAIGYTVKNPQVLNLKEVPQTGI